MQKLMLCLYGTEETGKTNTIVAAHRKFTERHPDAESIPQFSEIEGGDILVTVKLKGGIAMGFGSGGDDPEQVKANLREFRKNNCDIIVCATRTRGGTVDAVGGRLGSGYRRCWMTTCWFGYEDKDKRSDGKLTDEECSCRKRCNNAVAETVVEFLDDYIAKNS